VSLSSSKNLESLEINILLEKLLQSHISAISSLRAIYADLENTIDKSLHNLKIGGRLIFVGAGTSGRLGVIESSELYPTFSWPKNKAKFLIAGGKSAMFIAKEGAEDDKNLAIADAKKVKFNPTDVVFCLSASGKTPYTHTILQIAKNAGSLTIGISCAKGSPILKDSHQKLYLNTGDEVIRGSTRMAAGSAQKAVLNILTTTIMIKLNRVYDCHMIDLAMTNKKLFERGISIVASLCGVNLIVAKKAVVKSDHNLRLACVFLKYGNIEFAKKMLRLHNNDLRKCLEQE
jgi:N-acetylmuramic acid 6-phosphate etherase